MITGNSRLRHLWQFGEARCWARWIWEPFWPPNISSFLWKMLRHALPVDKRVQSRGIPLVFGCRCCEERSEETLIHLLIHSTVARQVWKFFAYFFKLPSEYRSILQALNIWMVGASATSQHGIIRRACSAYIFREIWVSQCSATYEDGIMRARNICVKV